MPLRALIALSLLFLTSAFAQEKGANESFRTWTSNNGQTLQARFVSFGPGVALLARANGQQLKIPTTQLSPADQDYLKIWLPYQGRNWSQVDSFTFDRAKKTRGYDFSIVPLRDEKIGFDPDFAVVGSPTMVITRVNESLKPEDTANWLLVSYMENSKELNAHFDEVGMINTKPEQALILPSPYTESDYPKNPRREFRLFVYIADRATGEPKSNILALDSIVKR